MLFSEWNFIIIGNKIFKIIFLIFDIYIFCLFSGKKISLSIFPMNKIIIINIIILLKNNYYSSLFVIFNINFIFYFFSIIYLFFNINKLCIYNLIIKYRYIYIYSFKKNKLLLLFFYILIIFKIFT